MRVYVSPEEVKLIPSHLTSKVSEGRNCQASGCSSVLCLVSFGGTDIKALGVSQLSGLEQTVL